MYLKYKFNWMSHILFDNPTSKELPQKPQNSCKDRWAHADLDVATITLPFGDTEHTVL